MKIEVIENPDNELIHFFEQRIHEFNVARWEVKQKFPLAIQVKNEKGELMAGAAAKTFGLWLIIDNLWVSESMRGHDLGSKVLAQLENAAKARGCKHVLLDTLDFQARPFYEKHGYSVKWTQENYPRDGRKFFMVKNLG